MSFKISMFTFTMDFFLKRDKKKIIWKVSLVLWNEQDLMKFPERKEH